MKKDIEWLREEVHALYPNSYSAYALNDMLLKAEMVDKIIDLIDQLDEPQKPVIPQIVADYIEKWEHDGLTMYEWFAFGNNDVDDDVNKWLYNNTNGENRRREYLLIDAIRYGYEVEKEKKYQVIVRHGEHIVLFLCKDEGNVVIGTNEYYIEKYPEATHLTKQEIKDYDKRYWVFAEEVTE